MGIDNQQIVKEDDVTINNWHKIWSKRGKRLDYEKTFIGGIGIGPGGSGKGAGYCNFWGCLPQSRISGKDKAGGLPYTGSAPYGNGISAA